MHGYSWEQAIKQAGNKEPILTTWKRVGKYVFFLLKEKMSQVCKFSSDFHKIDTVPLFHPSYIRILT